MTPAEIQVKIACANREAEYWQAILADQRCGNCIEFDGSQCGKYDAVPPEGGKQPGCPAWRWDSIAF